VETLLHIGLWNALLATALAFLAAGVGRLARRPALTHALWLLVLLKLVTPPLFTLSVPWPSSLSAGTGEALLISATQEGRVVGLGSTVQLPFPQESRDLEEVAVTAWRPDEEGLLLEDAAIVASLPEEANPVPAAESPLTITRATIAAAIWLAGSAAWLVLAGVRVIRFRRLLRFARPAGGELRQQIEQLGKRLGLAKPPATWLVPGPVAPMLWSVGQAPALLLPAGLWDRLSPEQQETLLAHELAHLKRRDHWVRVLELLATGLYWWHPAVWWARRELREAEEACCDAWVVWALPDSARAYASAIVDTLDYLCASGAAQPAEASGIGQVHSLKRRLTMILRGTTPRALTWGGLLAVLGVAVALLPWLPTWAQEDQPSRYEPRLARPEARKADDERAQAEKQRDEARRLADEQRGAQAERMRGEVQRLERQMAELRHQVEVTAKQLGETHRKLAELEGRRVQPVRPDVVESEPRREQRRQFEAPEGPRRFGSGFGRPIPEDRSRELEQRLEMILREVENLRREIRRPPSSYREGPPSDREGDRGPGELPRQTRQGSEDRIGIRPVAPVPPVAPRPPATPRPPRD
jgi:beta-lactamase regulating signal transducer with metallopeptidase domain